MRKTSSRAALFTLCVAFAAGSVARADTASEADLQFALGSELYKHRQYEEALQQFIASNRLVANRNVVFNIASVYGLLHRDADAYNWYETYLGFEGLDDAAKKRGLDAQAALAAKVAVVDVVTMPPGAELFVDRTDLGSVGVSPRRLAVPPGDRTLIARLAGHHDATAAVSVALGAAARAQLELAAVVGVLIVESVPPGAKVLRDDGSMLGVTPLQLTLPASELRLEVGCDGYASQSRTVTVRDGAETRVQLTLAMTADRSAVLTVQGEPAGAQVTLAGRPIGAVPLSVPGLTPGAFELTVDAPGHEPFRVQVLLEAGAATRVDFDLIETRALDARRFKWLGYGAGAAALIAGIIVGVIATSAHASYVDAPSRAAYDAVSRDNAIADGLMLSGAVVLVGTGLVDLFVLRTWHTTGEAHVVR